MTTPIVPMPRERHLQRLVPWSPTPVTLQPAEPTPLSHQIRVSGVPDAVTARDLHDTLDAALRTALGDWHAHQFGGPMQYNRSASLVIRVRLDPPGGARGGLADLRCAELADALLALDGLRVARAPVDFSRPPSTTRRSTGLRLRVAIAAAAAAQFAADRPAARRWPLQPLRAWAPASAPAAAAPPEPAAPVAWIALGGLPPELADAQILELLKTAGEVRAFSRETGAAAAGCAYADEAQAATAVDVLDGLELRGHKLTAAIDASAAARPPGASARAGAPRPKVAAAAPAVVYTLALHNIADDALLASDADRVRADVASECAEMGDVVGAPRLPLPGDAAGLTVGSAYVDFREKADAERVRRALDGRSYGGRRVMAVVHGDEGGAEAAEAVEAVEAPAAAEPTGGRRKRRWEPAEAAPPDEPSSEVG